MASMIEASDVIILSRVLAGEMLAQGFKWLVCVANANIVETYSESMLIAQRIEAHHRVMPHLA